MDLPPAAVDLQSARIWVTVGLVASRFGNRFHSSAPLISRGTRCLFSAIMLPQPIAAQSWQITTSRSRSALSA